MSIVRKLLVACVALASALPAWAGTATGTLTVNATVVSNCTVAAATLNFGTTIVATIAANIDVSTTFNVTCANTVPYSVDLGVGTGPAPTFANRQAKQGANVLNYSLYLDNARTQVWGDNTGGTVHATGTGSGAAQSLSVFGRLFPQSATATGAYTDAVTITVNF